MKKEMKKSATRRLAIIAGQVKGVQDMVDEDAYCVDVIAQIEAIREALSATGQIVLKNHLLTHVAHKMSHGQVEDATDEMLKIYKLAKK